MSVSTPQATGLVRTRVAQGMDTGTHKARPCLHSGPQVPMCDLLDRSWRRDDEERAEHEGGLQPHDGSDYAFVGLLGHRIQLGSVHWNKDWARKY